MVTVSNCPGDYFTRTPTVRVKRRQLTRCKLSDSRGGRKFNHRGTVA